MGIVKKSKIEDNKLVPKSLWLPKSTEISGEFTERYKLIIIVATLSTLIAQYFTENDEIRLFTDTMPLIPMVLLYIIAVAQTSKTVEIIKPRFLIAACVGYIWWVVFFYIMEFSRHEYNFTTIVGLLNLVSHAYLLIILPLFTVRLIKENIKPCCIEDSSYISYIWVSGLFSASAIISELMSESPNELLGKNIYIFVLVFSNLVLMWFGIQIRRYILRKQYE